MMKRATITVKGDVQDIGFRQEIKKRARRLRLSGTAENLSSGDVRIVCEGPEAAIRALLASLDAEHGLPGIERVRARRTPARGGMRGFSVVREKDFENAVFRKLDAGVAQLKGIRSDIRTMSGRIGGMSNGIGRLDRNTGGHFRRLDRNIGGHFRRLDRKYDRFGDTMERVARDIHDMRGDLRRAVGPKNGKRAPS